MRNYIQRTPFINDGYKLGGYIILLILFLVVGACNFSNKGFSSSNNTKQPVMGTSAPAVTPALPLENTPTKSLSTTLHVSPTSSFPITTTNYLIPSMTKIKVPTNGAVSQISTASSQDIVAAGTNNGVWIYDIQTHKLIKSIAQGLPCSSLNFIPENNILAIGSPDGNIYWWNPDKDLFLGTINDHLLGVTHIVPIPNMPSLVSSSDDGRVIVWDVSSARENKAPPSKKVFTNSAAQNRISSLAASPDSRYIAIGTHRKVIILSPAGNEMLQSFSRFFGWVRALTFSPDSKHLIIADGDLRILFYSTNTWEQESSEIVDVPGEVTALSTHPDGSILAIGTDRGVIQIWEFVSPDLHHSEPTIQKTILLSQEGAITDLRFDQQGTVLVASSDDGNIFFFPFVPVITIHEEP
ncbi:MAG: hypothetical protein J7L73_01550 [Anaerolineales bacterium]|nr:hypothetical protein [Anaerolineales bacterium]